MRTLKVTAGVATTILLLTSGVRDAGAAPITATVSDRGSDLFPWDGVMATVFGNPGVIAIQTPPLPGMGTEERTGVEFPLASIPAGSIIDSVSLQISPVGTNTNIGLGAGEVSDIHGYAGNGAIEVADLNDSLLVGSIAGPSPNGFVTVALSTAWLQSLVDSSSPFAGLMFKGVPGPIAVIYNFDSAFGGVPGEERPTLLVEHHAGGVVVPEPSAVVLLVFGVAATAMRRTRRAFSSRHAK